MDELADGGAVDEEGEPGAGTLSPRVEDDADEDAAAMMDGRKGRSGEAVFAAADVLF